LIIKTGAAPKRYIELMKKWFRRLRWPFLGLVVLCFVLSVPEMLHQNKGESTSVGTVWNGRLENGWLMPYSGPNFGFFSALSYGVFDNGYTHSTTYRTILDAYKICETTCPGTFFRLMETSDKHGGRLLIHRTHQNGTSADFMVPKKRKGRPSTFFDHLGYFHYLLDFDEKGRLYGFRSVEIDFDAVGRHLLALGEAARKNGQRIRKVILRLELKDELYATPSGQQLRERNVYIVQNLPYWTNRVHDDHYHVDFE
jgi:penicillin-insensitive murein DD-endopeptidase